MINSIKDASSDKQFTQLKSDIIQLNSFKPKNLNASLKLEPNSQTSIIFFEFATFSISKELSMPKTLKPCLAIITS